ncbi:hypothetical protein [Herbaspirillum camelliae]|uniref:hypothetical protein n=1 Tax=Herbaspirillum camelliae TaxID=1892903 RepID=UPI0009FA541D|nr:hypothetical protein [Herbaspirillum camelliae]
MLNGSEDGYRDPSTASETDRLQKAPSVFKNVADAGAALSTSETVSRFGDASAEFVKALRGVDNAAKEPIHFAKSHAGIFKNKINAQYAEQNIKQQAGYSAEVAATAKDNSEFIISRSKVRASRSDDLEQFGKNHPVVDRVRILDGEIIDGSPSQMKFVGDRSKLFNDIAKPDGKFCRYRGAKLELPSEQYKDAAQFCRDKAAALRKNAARAQAKGNAEAAARLDETARNYDQLADNVMDSGLTTEQAIFYRLHPELATALDIAKNSHRAGMEGAKYGAIIGACISVVQNGYQFVQGDADAADAIIAVAGDTAKAAAIGYATAATGSAIKSVMQQSGNQAVRNLAGTSAPVLALSACIALGSSIKRYVKGEINEAQFLMEIGEKGSGMLATGMMGMVGQIAIPIPFVGAAIGGMIGCMLSNLFYQSAVDAAREAQASRELLARTRIIEQAARQRIAEEQAQFDAFNAAEIPALQSAVRELSLSLSVVTIDGDEIATSVNRFATLLGKQLEFGTKTEFDAFMLSDRPLTL